MNAYEVLGVSERSSFEEIKASFRKLAKETHPDVSTSPDEGAVYQRFLQILAAYEILSNSERRAHYDSHLLSHKMTLQKKSMHYSVMYQRGPAVALRKPKEVIQWLSWYKQLVNDIVTQNKVASGSGYFNNLEGELYSAISFAYYGPIVESLNLLPDCFEAEERSSCETSEVLHLVSGRDLFGIVCTVEKFPELLNVHSEILPSFSSDGRFLRCHSNEMLGVSSRLRGCNDIKDLKLRQIRNMEADTYKKLELHVCGKLVATATRDRPHSEPHGESMADNKDRINVFLNLNMNSRPSVSSSNYPSTVDQKILLGTITGLGSEAEEGICSVYDQNGQKTHFIIKHRTLMVKHMHWFRSVEDEFPTYECRCSRSRLPPSQFWLFEPRSNMHDVGGWYVETFGQNKKGRTVHCKRHWDGVNEHSETRLHPAMYLFALAYRTLDLEDEKGRKKYFRDLLERKLQNMLRWCRRIL